MGRQMNKRGIDFIKNEEGLRLQAYDDATGRPVPAGGAVRGVLTIGYGHTGTDVHAGQIITEAEAERLLDHDNNWAEEAVEKACVGPTDKPLRPNDNEFAALVSLCFNIGPAGFKGSTVVRMWNKGEKMLAANAFHLWNKSTTDGVMQINPVLVGRRAREVAVFCEPMPSAVEKPMPQVVEKPATAAVSKTVITTAAAGAATVASVADQAAPALEAINQATTVISGARTTWEGVKDAIGPLLSSPILPVVLGCIVIGLLLFVGIRYVLKARRGDVVVT